MVPIGTSLLSGERVVSGMSLGKKNSMYESFKRASGKQISWLSRGCPAALFVQIQIPLFENGFHSWKNACLRELVRT